MKPAKSLDANELSAHEKETPAALYIDLMKRCLLDSIYAKKALVSYYPQKFWKRKIFDIIRARNLDIVTSVKIDEGLIIDDGIGWPYRAHTMIGRKRLNNLQFCVEEVIKGNFPGDLIETGVWRGGATIFMRAILKAYGVKDRKVWVADSFAGLPPPDEEKYLQDKEDVLHTYKQLAVSLEEVKANFELYDLLDAQVCFLKGWFKDTLPNAPIEKLAVIRLDGDMYESTMDGLNNLYHKLSPGGFLIVDDYGLLPACKQAVHDFRDKNGIKEEIISIDQSGVYWQRQK